MNPYDPFIHRLHVHRAVVRNMREHSRFLMDQVAEKLPSAVFEAAVARGQQLELHQLVNDLRTQFSQ